MPPLQRPTWVVPLWWADDATRTTISGTELVQRWHERMPPPKPPKKALVAELTGWSGRLGAAPWVRERYRERPAQLARGSGLRRIPLDEPDNWYDLSRLYRDYADPLARFSAQFAALVAPLAPKGLPENGWAHPLKNRVPPMVRAVMAGPADGPVGGVIDSADAALAFLASTDDHRDRYAAIARRGYLSVLLDRLDALRYADSPDATVLRILDETIAEHAAEHGDPEQPLRRPTPTERRHANAVLAAIVAEHPAIRRNPYFGDAYERALRVLLRWIVEGRDTVDGRILFNALTWARLDARRAEIRRARAEVPFPDHPAAEAMSVSAHEDIDTALDLRDTLARAEAALLGYVEDGPAPGRASWEKTTAAALLSGRNSLALMAFPTLDALVGAAWHAAVPEGASAPEGAAEADPAAAARYVHTLLCTAILLVSPTGGAATARLARMRHTVHAELAAHRAAATTDTVNE